MVVQPYMSYFQVSPIHHKQRISMQNRQRKRSCSPIVSVLSSDNRNIELSMSSSFTDDQISQIAYKDNWFELLAINHLSNTLQSASGLRSKKNGYDGLVEAARMASKRFTPTEQRQVVIKTLAMAFPKPIMSLIKTLLPSSKFAREYFAVFTTIFFPWLVGPCEVKESEFEGRKEKNVVYIPKCRFLEGTNCVGMCTNLCKMPSQAFIKETLGMPFTMVPNFDDMSCEMIFGEEPPSQEDDPAFAQPCYKQCEAKYRHQNVCAGE